MKLTFLVRSLLATFIVFLFGLFLITPAKADLLVSQPTVSSGNSWTVNYNNGLTFEFNMTFSGQWPVLTCKNSASGNVAVWFQGSQVYVKTSSGYSKLIGNINPNSNDHYKVVCNNSIVSVYVNNGFLGNASDSSINVPSSSFVDQPSVSFVANGFTQMTNFTISDSPPNAIPVVTSLTVPTGTQLQNTPISISGAFTDADTLDTHIASISWGDGASSSCQPNSSQCTLNESNGLGSVTGSHAYSSGGDHTVQLTITDQNGANDAKQATVHVNLPPVLNYINANGLNGYSATGTFSDGDSTSWTATVDYGDGSGIHPLSVDSQNQSFSLSHTYTGTDSQTSTITITVTDNQGVVSSPLHIKASTLVWQPTVGSGNSWTVNYNGGLTFNFDMNYTGQWPVVTCKNSASGNVAVWFQTNEVYVKTSSGFVQRLGGINANANDHYAIVCNDNDVSVYDNGGLLGTATDSSINILSANSVDQPSVSFVANGFTQMTNFIIFATNPPTPSPTPVPTATPTATPTPTPTPTPSGPSISGTVKDNTGTAIAGTTVGVTDSVTGASLGSTTTDSNGSYKIFVTNGTYNVQVTPPTGSSFTPAIALSQVVSGDKIINFVLVPTGTVTLSGHVYNQDGTPLSNVHVYLPPSNGNLLVQATTDVNGFYQITAAPGVWTSGLDADGFGTSTNHLPGEYAVRGQGSFDLTQSKILDITIPANKVDITTQDTSQSPISGVQLTTSNNTSATVVIGGGTYKIFTSYASNDSLKVFTDSSGKGTLWLVNTGYSVVATPPSGSGFVTTSVNVSVSGATQITITLPSPVSLTGHITNQDGTVLSGVRLDFPPSNGNPLVQTSSDNSGFYSLTAVPATWNELDADGFGSLSLHMPEQYGLRGQGSFTLSQNTTMDIPFSAQQVTVHVQDSNQNPMSGVKLTTSSGPQGSLVINNYTFKYYANYSNPGVTTDANGNATMWLFNGGYSLIATPPSGSGLSALTTSLTVSNATQKTIQFTTPVVLSGHVYNKDGAPVQGVHIYLPPNGGAFVQGTTDTNGFYQISALPGTWTTGLDLDGNGTDAQHMPQAYGLRATDSFTLNQDTTLDFTLPAKLVTIHVQDGGQNPVSGIHISVPDALQSSFTFGGHVFRYYAETTGGVNGGVTTDNSGNATLWMFVGNYSFIATPPSGSIYLPFTLSGISVTGDQTEIISLQFNHPRPVTTIALSPAAYAQGDYHDPTTVTLSATAASGYTLANTYYTVDGGVQQTYTTPFTVSLPGSHTITYWSIDNSGVYEATNTKTFAIHSNTPPTITLTGSTTVNEGDTVTYSFAVTDPDAGDAFSVIGDPNCGSNGTYVPNSLTLTAAGGTFQCRFPNGSVSSTVSIQVADSYSAASNVATQTVNIDNIAPTLGAIDAPTSPVEPGSDVTITTNFIDPGVNDSFSSTIDWGDGNSSSGTITQLGGTGSVTGSHTYTTAGTYTVTITVIDANGGSSTSTTQIIVNAPPTANANGPYAVNEGSSVTLSGTGTDSDNDALTYAWDLDNNGTYESSGQSVLFQGVDGDATKTVGLKVCDPFGACATDTAMVTVTNVSPAAGAITVSPSQPQQNQAISASSSFTDPGTVDTHTISWDWGDGNTTAGTVTESNGSGSATDSHTYTTYGTYTITMTVTDKDGGIGTSTKQIFVNAPPVANAGGSYIMNEGDMILLTGSATDPDNDVLTYSWDLDNSGTYSLTGQTALFSASDGPATKTVNLKVCDSHGACDTSSATVIVSNVAPVVSTLNLTPAQLQQGDTVTANASFTDPGTLDTHTATIDWGDGTNSSGVVAENNGSGSVSGTHTYPTFGTYTVTVTVTDKDGGVGTKSSSLFVNAPPTANAGGQYAVNEGSLVVLQGTGADPDGDSLTYSWDLNNDGIYDVTGQSVPFSAVDGPASKTVKLQVCDTHNACATDTTTITINNVVPTITAVNVPSTPFAVGTSIAVNATYTDPGTLDTHTAVWDFGDGNTQQATIAESNGNGTASGNHTYQAAGVYTVSVTVTDKDGYSTSQQYQYIVVYDPSAGFINGSGQITSPVGADVALPSVTGKAKFGIQAKYQGNNTVPTGNAKFSFKNGDIDFSSTSYDWLVVSGNKAYLHGTGTVNGSGSYNFLITVIDGSPDTFRMKIKDNATNAVVYDNQMSASDFTDPAEAIDSGQIQVH